MGKCQFGNISNPLIRRHPRPHPGSSQSVLVLREHHQESEVNAPNLNPSQPQNLCPSYNIDTLVRFSLNWLFSNHPTTASNPTVRFAEWYLAACPSKICVGVISMKFWTPQSKTPHQLSEGVHIDVNQYKGCSWGTLHSKGCLVVTFSPSTALCLWPQRNKASYIETTLQTSLLVRHCVRRSRRTVLNAVVRSPNNSSTSYLNLTIYRDSLWELPTLSLSQDWLEWVEHWCIFHKSSVAVLLSLSQLPYSKVNGLRLGSKCKDSWIQRWIFKKVVLPQCLNSAG